MAADTLLPGRDTTAFLDLFSPIHVQYVQCLHTNACMITAVDKRVEKVCRVTLGLNTTFSHFSYFYVYVGTPFILYTYMRKQPPSIVAGLARGVARMSARVFLRPKGPKPRGTGAPRLYYCTTIIIKALSISIILCTTLCALYDANPYIYL